LRETCCCSTNLCTWRPNTVYKNRRVCRHQTSLLWHVIHIECALCRCMCWLCCFLSCICFFVIGNESESEPNTAEDPYSSTEGQGKHHIWTYDFKVF
jgi:hypothetical protein